MRIFRMFQSGRVMGTQILNSKKNYTNFKNFRQFSTPPPSKGINETSGWVSSGLVGICGIALGYASIKSRDFFMDDSYDKMFVALCAPPSKEDAKGGAKGKENCSKCEQESKQSCIRRLDQEEANIIKANADFEEALKDIKPKAQDASEVALIALCEAKDVVRKYLDRGYKAIEGDPNEQNYEEVWCCVAEVSTRRCVVMKDAMKKTQIALEYLCRLRSLLDKAKCCRFTKCNPKLVVAEEILLCGEMSIAKAKAELECLRADSCLIGPFANPIKDFKAELQKEVASKGGSECGCDKNKNVVTGCTDAVELAYKKVARFQSDVIYSAALKGKFLCNVREPCAEPAQAKKVK